MRDRTDNRITFTKAALDRIKAPSDGRTWHYDTTQPKLGLMTTANGVKSFYVAYRGGGSFKRHRIGGYPETTIEQARKAAAQVLGEVAKGSDPHALRQQQRGEPTLQRLYDAWLERAKLTKRSCKSDEREYRRFLTPWAGRRLSTIQAGEVSALHARVGREHGKMMANHVLILVRKLFNAADTLVDFDGPNPTRKIAKFPSRSRERFAQPHELPRLLAAVREETDEWLRDIVLLALLTAARRGNLQSMRFDDIDLKARTWTIPAAASKNGRTMTIQLVDDAIKIIERRAAQRSADCPWVFPADRNSGHITYVNKKWRKLAGRAGLHDLKFHDLRRTVASYATMGGEGLQVVGKMLGHSSLQSTQVYARLNSDTVRSAIERATNTILQLGSNQPKQPGGGRGKKKAK